MLPHHHHDSVAGLAVGGSQHRVRREQRAAAEQVAITEKNNAVVNIFWFYCQAPAKAWIGNGSVRNSHHKFMLAAYISVVKATP